VFELIKKFFGSSKRAAVVALDDADFGRLTFFEDPSGTSTGIWQTHDRLDLPEAFAKVGSSSIPGTAAGPFPESRAFLLEKRASLLALWEQASPYLEEMRQKWRADTGARDLQEVFVLSDVALHKQITGSAPNWEVSFETREGLWICAHLQFKGSVFVDASCDT
jgi:hypothetical protein